MLDEKSADTRRFEVKGMLDSRPAIVKRLDLEDDRRIIVVSDIHGHLDNLKGVLKKAGFCDRDELIINGDFLEKGPYSLATLRYIMELYKRGNVEVICGNCDDCAPIYDEHCQTELVDWHVLHYVLHKKSGLLWDMCNELGLDLFEYDSFTECKRILRERFPAEWDFLMRIPHSIEMENFVFAHAAVYPDKPLRKHTVDEFVRCDRFLSLGLSFDKWVVLGHYPTVLYGTDKVCANPLVDYEHKVICIDGACVLKYDGQLNAFIIPNKSSEDFSFVSYDGFPERMVLSDQEGSETTYYIRWGDSEVEVLEQGEEFSRVRHIRTGYEMDVLTKHLITGGEVTEVDDVTDYVLPLKAGDVVRVVEKCSRGYFVKHHGYSGWYFGELGLVK